MDSVLTQVLKDLKDTRLRSEIIDCANIKAFKKGEILQMEGKPIKAVIIVLKGSVKVVMPYEDRKEFLLYYINPGGTCARGVLVSSNEGLSPIKLICEQAGEALFIPIQNALSWIGRFPTFTYFVLNAYECHIQNLVRSMYQGQTQSFSKRIWAFLDRKRSSMTILILQ